MLLNRGAHDGGRILSTGNFHTGALALAADTLAIALVPVADLAVGRAMKLMLPEASGLAKFLTPVGGNRAGFAPIPSPPSGAGGP